ncbi:sensor histidine kinase [Massilia sp. IC2-477]|uniref:sensor histidine kinase n=1 Tax=Massilia sp. IC2-477 TaxID=2887198 RepID=UPI001D0FD85D|nr:sensor histidine kinase [Massilia sp. IC2-477]MCC2958082.1 sensor histidine kinase [Massilia sp. IC2-477]
MKKIMGMLKGPWVPPEQGRMPYFWLLSLGYMGWKYAYITPGPLELAMLILTLGVFVPLYFASYWARGWQVYACMLAGCLIGTAWVRWNPGAATFFIFACAMAAGIDRMKQAMLAIGAIVVCALLASLQIKETRFMFLMPILTISLPVGFGSVMDARLRRSRQQLMRKQEEVEHMATIAERERISRDLHDLLGHSLSLIALKAELARKLVHRDADACAREVGDIEASARQALAEVRAAVTGYREKGLASALASARASLAAADVRLEEKVERIELAPAAENVVALALREAVTNVVRHAGASRCSVSLSLEHGVAVLRILDDGKARSEADIRHGNGLSGMRERVASVGGRLALRARAGLELELRIPTGATS